MNGALLSTNLSKKIILPNQSSQLVVLWSMKTQLTIFLSLFLMLGCQKKDIRIPIDEIQGDYEWYYSNNGQSFDNNEDQYGIQITKKGRLKLFKNGELVDNLKIITTNDWPDMISIGVKMEGEFIYFELKESTLSTQLYPFEGDNNYYSKHH